MSAVDTAERQNPRQHPLELCLNLSRAALLLTRRLDHVLSSVHGLSFSDFVLLLHLGRARNFKLRRIDLAQKSSLTASGVTRALLPLEKRGLVSREKDSRDARVGFAILTVAGQELLAHATRTAEHLSEDVLGPVAPSQREALAQALFEVTTAAQVEHA